MAKKKPKQPKATFETKAVIASPYPNAQDCNYMRVNLVGDEIYLQCIVRDPACRQSFVRNQAVKVTLEPA